MERVGLLGLVVAFLSLIVAESLSGGELSFLVNLPAFIIVVGGTVGAVFFQSSVPQFSGAMLALKDLFHPPQYAFHEQIYRIEQWSNTARQKGFLALEKVAADGEHDGFTDKGLNMIIDGVDAATMRGILEQDIDLKQEQLELQAKVYEAMGGYSPTIGIIGAVMGLIQAMSAIDDPTVLGKGIAAAFVATIYGVGFANLLFLPIYHKLKVMNQRRAWYQEMTVEGLVAIVNGENSLTIKRRLEAFTDEGR
ncbi:flagellar motor protein [Motilimonas pumila]|uniref:Flagellar motor protein n=1 Tax=Motilimonas pumila TaxID=2303987 RepID=A0A418YGV4_9GAMM|nr:flagellar motor protein [Motilimonas pumila]RJG49043.1 flagellar motor protein [Motilimonas pumila]